MANSVAISMINGQNVQPDRSELSRDVTLTLTSDGSNYVAGGIAFSDTTNWHKASQINNIRLAIPLSTLRLADFSASYPFEIDITNGKVVLYALGASPAEAEPLAEHKTATAVPTGDYTATLRIVGF